MAFLERLLAESKIASRMNQDPSIIATTLDDYMKKRGEQLQQENPSAFAALEKA
ncbi:hypothetical protein KA478_03965 [Patescibacteria group bacterium]|nr:hypothetical protein [Patescibacteria group bacterium]